jgi:hypothetical protein
MGSVLISVAVALGVQFLCLPLLIGARHGAEAVGWTMILAIFFAMPSAGIYLLVFASLKAAALPPLVTLLIGALVPPALAAAFFWKKERWAVFSRQNYVVRMLLFGGVAGSALLSSVLDSWGAAG